MRLQIKSIVAKAQGTGLMRALLRIKGISRRAHTHKRDGAGDMFLLKIELKL
jgi:hypothetical protein